MALVGFAAAPAPVHAAVRVTDVRVESRVNPMTIDVQAPRFSWVVRAAERGARQTGYQILVASSADKLKQGEGDLWDSGKVASDENIQIAYAGAPLTSRRRYHVSVRAWDGKDKPALPAVAFFETGVLDSALWQAKFIGLAPVGDDERSPLAAGQWIWAPEPKDPTKIKRVTFRHSFTVPADAYAKLRFAELVLSAPGGGKLWDNKNRRKILINETKLREFPSPVWDPRALPVTAAIKAGDNTIAIESPYVPKATMATAFVAVLRLELTDGKIQTVASDGTWRARLWAEDKLDEDWHRASAAEPPWTAAEVRGRFGDAVDSREPAFQKIDKILPAIYLRKAFRVGKSLRRARLDVTAAGIYEAYLNGKRVGQDVLAPGWTDYDARLRYQSYDVTAQVKAGDNVVGGIVAEGWFSGRTGMGQNLWGFEKALFAELVLDYQDGTSEVVATDESWQGTTGPIRRADMLDGEVYDARRELGAWSAPGKASAGWRPVIVQTPKVGRLEGQIEQPVRATMTLPTRTVVSPAPGVQIFDLGQNMVGWVRLKVKAAAGTRVTLRFSEMLAKDGSMFTDNLRTAIAVDHYIARGGGVEVYEPRFAFHGFRFVEISGAGGALPPSAVTGVVVTSDLPPAGKFQTSNAMLNQLQSNIVWGQRGNFLSIPTDCPQRDERLGWTGDINMFARTATFNMDSAAFLAKFMVDLEDGQSPDGRFPDVAPTTSVLGGGNFAWADVGVMLPWLLFQNYGDRRVLERHYDAMKRWVVFRNQGAKDWLNTANSFGDWVSPKPQAPNKVIGPIYHAAVARLLGQAAAVLGKSEDASFFNGVSTKIRTAFNRAYVAADGKIESDTQSAYILALHYDMLPEDKRAAATEHLVAAIGRAGNHLATGFLGTGNLLPALSENGRTDLAYQLLLTDTFPSWLFTVKNGATTMWERWDSYSPEKGPSNLGDMNSYNHYAFGAVGEWMYAHVAGLDRDPSALAWKKIVIKPVVGGGLSHATAEHESPRGKVVSAWKVAGGTFALDVEVPVHATATVHVPAANAEAVKEGGKPTASATGVRFVAMTDGAALFEVQSGRYRFTAPHR
jgi:alpha-L-rhamnosidase